MEYEALMKQAKDLFQLDNAAFEEQYKKAADALKNQFDASVTELTKEYESSKNQAAAESMKNRHNTREMLASRGLAKSGESIQEEINHNLSYDNKMATLASAHQNALSEIENERASNMLSLENDRINKASDNAKWQSEQAYKFAKDEMDKAERKASAEREFQQQIELYKLQQADKERLIKEEREYNDKKAESGAMNKDDVFFVNNMANIILSTATDGKHSFSTQSDMVAAQKLLDALKENGLDDTYIAAIEKNMIALGYYTPSETVKSNQKIVRELDKIYGDAYRKEYYDLYEKQHLSPVQAAKLAQAKAVQAELAYIAEHCEDITAFYDIAEEAKIPLMDAYGYAEANGFEKMIGKKQ